MSSFTTSNAPATEQKFTAPQPSILRDYPTPAKVLHWLTALLVLCMVSAGIFAKQLGGSPAGELLLGIHKFVGVVTMVLVLIRLGYRLARTVPQLRAMGQKQPMLHRLLYVVLLAVPLLGWAGVSDEGDRGLPWGLSLPPIWPQGAGYDELLLHAHAYIAFALLAFVALHIGVAIQDQVYAPEKTGAATCE